MTYDTLPLLQCPSCHTHTPLTLQVDTETNGEVETGALSCDACQATYAIHKFIPRFVPSENYAQNFGFQWNKFRQTQLDSYNGTTISRDRFVAQWGASCELLKGARILDAGCGSGRFAEIALDLGAEVFAFDFSTAVDACWQNLGKNPRLQVFQADIFNIPFQPAQFDFVYSFGVLQHTPSSEKAIYSLAKHLKPGGRLCVDIYAKQWKNIFESKYWFRPITKRLPQAQFFNLVEKTTPTMLSLSRAIGRLPGGKYMRRLIPVADYESIHPLSENQRCQWAILDTFDWLAPQYDQPQTAETIAGWMKACGLQDVISERMGVVVGQGQRGEDG